MPTQTEWKSRPPTEPGWYWWRRPSHDDEIVRVERLFSRTGVSLLIASRTKTSSGYSPEEMGGLWKGPILAEPGAEPPGHTIPESERN